MASRESQRSSGWLTPETEQHGLQRYIVTLRERWWVIALCVLAALAAAIGYLAVAEKVYEAQADMLVTPVARDDETTVGLGLIRDSNDPTRDVSTASRLVTTVPVARRVIREIQPDERSPTRLLESVVAEPLAQSSIVTVTAKADSPEEAAELANAFALETVRLQTARLRDQLSSTIPSLRERVDALPPEERTPSNPLVARLSALEALRSVPDPTLRVLTPAEPPERQAAPRPRLTIAGGLFAGLILGLGGAFAFSAIDPRLRREEQLRQIYRLPILARVPKESHKRNAGALPPSQLSTSTLEAYRTLRSTVAASRANEFRSRSILITSSSPGEGKTTSAINFAHSLVQAGNRVILIEADMHRPTIGPALGVTPRYGIGAVLIRQVALADALVTTEEYGPDLQLLLVDRPGHATADRLSLPTARQLVGEAEELADYVVIDSPPLTAVVDALPLAQEVSHVLVVARLGKSKLRKLTELGEILEQNGIEPSGVALVGVDKSGAGYYYAAESRPGRQRQRETVLDA